jgi:lysophospholipase L1-like esterase
VRLGCGGATTESMIRGTRPCGEAYLPYESKSRKTSQLTYGAKWIREHSSQVKYVTLTIGGNDFASCTSAGDLGAVVECTGKGIEKMKKNLPVIAKALRKAAGPEPTIVGSTYPDVVLGAYVQSEDGKNLAAASVEVFRQQINPAMKKAYSKRKIGFIDATDEFGGYIPFERTTTLAPYGEIPVAVANICKFGWFCERPDIHLRSNGYAKLAKLFLAEIRRPS